MGAEKKDRFIMIGKELYVRRPTVLVATEVRMRACIGAVSLCHLLRSGLLLASTRL